MPSRAALAALQRRPKAGTASARQGDSLRAAARCSAAVVLSVVDATIGGMDVTDRDVARIPPRNIRVPRAEFAAVWKAAERRLAQRKDWYSCGVVMTCQWLAVAQVRPKTGAWYMAPAPVTRRSGSAYEELIDAEAVAAEVLLSRRPPDVWVVKRPGYVEAILATLNWAWRRSEGAPITVTDRLAG